MTIDTLAEWMVPFAHQVGFAEAKDPGAASSGVRLWRSSYALLGVWPVLGDTAESLRAAQGAGEAWLEDRLIEEERRGDALDGYLVLVLAAAPGPELRAAAQHVELDARFCRKHVVWPDPEIGRWDRLLRVTALGLPDVGVTNGPAPGPQLTAEQARLVALVTDGRSLAAAVDAVRDDADAERED